MVKFECSICYNEYEENNRNKKISCYCGSVVCNHCQKRYAKASCMNCKSDFSKDVIENLLGKVFVQNVIKKNKIKELIDEEKEFISATDELLKYLDKQKEDKELLRKGIIKSNNVINSERPIIRGKFRNEYCSLLGCKGTLKLDINNKKYGCIICKKVHCVDCLCIKEDENHVCDKNVLETLKSLENDTKRCPNCATRIYKTEGCNHMNCINCNTHFDWITGKIGVYNYNPNVPIKRVENGICLNMDEEQIPRNLMENIIPEKLMKLLYDETNNIRKYFKNECDYNKILNNYYISNDDLRVKYLKNELNEEVWGRFLFTNYKNMKLKVNYRDVIELYLLGINNIQSEIYNNFKNVDNQNEYFDNMYKSVINLMKECNISFEKINDEFYCETTLNKYNFNIPEEDNDDYLILSKSKVKVQKKRKVKSALNQIFKKENIEDNKKDIEVKEDIEIKEEEEEKKNEINLFEYQLPHFERMYNILATYNFALDLSPLGTGKTYISGKYIEINPQFKHIYIICPASLRSKWNDVSKTHNLKNVEVYSYNEVAGLKMTNPKHGLLIRNDFKTMRLIDGKNTEVEMASFRVSEKYKSYYDNGELLFIFDEIQHIRNGTSYTTNASRELMKHILHNKKGNKMICISGTPFDKQEQIITFMRNIGIQESDELVSHNRFTGVYKYKGYAEIIDYCKKIDDEKRGAYWYNEIITNKYMSAERCKMNAYNIFLNVIMKYLVSHMTMTEKNKYKIINQNTFYHLSPESDKICKAAINRILDLMNDDGTIDEHQRRVNIFRSLPILETSKLEIFDKEVAKQLTKNPYCKVVCALNYTDNIDDLINRLKEYNPQKLDGSVNTNKRAEIIKKFQEPTIECRLLIANISVIASGIDLDDKIGDFPRYVFVSPTYKIIEMNQLSFRFLRSLDTKSDTLIRYVYSYHSVNKKDLDEALKKYMEEECYLNEEKCMDIPIQNKSINEGTEMRILYHLSKKANVMKSISKEDVEFPCDFKCKVVFN